MSSSTTTIAPPQPTLSTPALLLLALVTFLGLRYYLSSPNSTSSTSSTSTNSNYPSHRNAQRRRIPNDKIDQVLAMFPQCERRDVEWELRRNGGSVQACCERVLRRGSLEGAPTSFRAQTPPPPPASSSSTTTTSAQTPKHPDLITRYNLSSRIPPPSSSSSSSTAHTSSAGTPSTPASKAREPEIKSGWSSSKVERAELLKRRREEMILEARRRLVEKDGGS